MTTLHDLLHPERLTSIVDVGAAILDEKPPYQRMLEEGLCTVVGFEPQPDALAELDKQKGPNETYLGDAIGNGQPHLLHLTQHQGMVSFLEPDPERVALFHGFPKWAEVKLVKPFPTRRLDDVDEIGAIDFIKIDAQGYEMEVLRSARYKLGHAVAIQAEVALMPLYRNQPTIGDMDQELRAMGFVPHCFASARVMPLATPVDLPHHDPHQIVDADLLYVRDFGRPMATEQWKHLALIAHHIAGSFDLAMLAVSRLAKIGACLEDAPERYRTIIEEQAK